MLLGYSVYLNLPHGEATPENDLLNHFKFERGFTMEN